MQIIQTLECLIKWNWSISFDEVVVIIVWIQYKFVTLECTRVWVGEDLYEDLKKNQWAIRKKQMFFSK